MQASKELHTMSNSQPQVQKEEKKTRSSRPRLKDKFKKVFPKWKVKPKKTSTGKFTRKEQKAKQKAERKKSKPRRRAFPIWLRIIVVLLLSAIALVIGAMVGYGIIGSGKPSDALEMDTWRHIFDIVSKNTQ